MRGWPVSTEEVCPVLPRGTPAIPAAPKRKTPGGAGGWPPAFEGVHPAFV